MKLKPQFIWSNKTAKQNCATAINKTTKSSTLLSVAHIIFLHSEIQYVVHGLSQKMVLKLLFHPQYCVLNVNMVYQLFAKPSKMIDDTAY